MSDRKPLVSFFRGLAIIMVVLCHSKCHFELTDAMRIPLDFCQMGCQVFFVMSSYCLCFSYKNKASTVSFYKRRLLSIAPGYWTIVVVNLFAAFVLGKLFTWPFPLNTGRKGVSLNLLLLHGFSFDMEIMNNVVFGGWFIGTMVVFYALFPILFRLYFGTLAHWDNSRYFIFPIAFLLFDILVCIILEKSCGIVCDLNNALYYSFVNQLPAFVCGLSLFDMMEKEESKEHPFFAVVFLLLAYVVFCASNKLSYIFCPWLMAMGSAYAYRYFSHSLKNHNSKLFEFVCKLGEKSYAIFLIHFWAVAAMVTFIRKYTFFSVMDCSENVLYLLMLPLILVVSYFLGVVFDKYLSSMHHLRIVRNLRAVE